MKVYAKVTKVLNYLKDKLNPQTKYRLILQSRGTASAEDVISEAADITLGSKAENKSLFEIIKTLVPYDQLIVENDFQWLHVSYRRFGDNRRRFQSTTAVVSINNRRRFNQQPLSIYLQPNGKSFTDCVFISR